METFEDLGAVSNTAPQNYKADKHSCIVASRPDWLTVSLPDLDQSYLPDLMADLSGRLGSEESLETEYEFFGARIFLQRDGAGRPRLIADNYCELRFYNHVGRVSAQFTIYSFPFWVDDALTVFLSAHGLIGSICGRDVQAVPVRLDLARDVTGFDLDSLGSLDAIYNHVVTRSRKKKPVGAAPSDEMTIEGGKHVETVYLGGASAPVRWSIYDKTLESGRKGKTYYAPIWLESGYDGEARIVRFEARLRGKVWRELELHGVSLGLPSLTLLNLSEWLAPLWSWLTQSHTRMVIPDAEQSNRTRLVTSAFWGMMQAPFDDAGVVVALQRVRLRQPKREALGAQSEGALLTMAALTPGAESWNASEIASATLGLVAWRCGSKGQTWKARVMERRALLAVS